MIRTIPELIASLRVMRSDLAAAYQNLSEQRDDIGLMLDAMDDTINFLIERHRQPPTDQP